MATNLNLDDVDLEIFTLIWLDATINEFENKTIQTKLHKLSDQFHSFDNRDDCESFIQSVPIDERIVLIVSGRFGREIVPRIHTIEQIYLIYVYCFDGEGNRQWAENYSKIKNVITKPNELIEQILHDNKREISPINNKQLYINVYQNNLDNQFIYLQLLINHLLKIKICCNSDSSLFKLYKIDDFQENYTSEKSLWWLTKDQYLSELISQALHTKNIDLLYLTCSYLRDINEQLELHQSSTSIHVYHSHLMNDEEIELLKTSIGKLISINTFFITTDQRDKALLDLKQTTNEQKILFEIDADPSIEEIKSFADITSFSYSKKQSQIIFMLGSIFRINNFFQQNHIWICQMTLSSENDLDLKSIFQQIKKEDSDYETNIISFGNMLARMNQYDDAEKYYQYVLKESPLNHPNRHICYRNLGNIAYLKKDYDQSLEYHMKSLEIKKQLLKSDDLDIADSYNCLGIVYFNKNNYQQAIDSYEKSLQILELNLNENYLKIVVCLNNIALVYRIEENYSKAFDCYKKILNIQKRYLSEDHIDLGQTYHNIGAFSWCLGFYDDAIKYYTLSLEIKYQYLSAKHSSIAMTLENVGLIYENKNDFQIALEYYKKAADIYRQILPANDADVQQINENILRVSTRLNKK